MGDCEASGMRIYRAVVGAMMDEGVMCNGPLGSALIWCEDAPRAIFRVRTLCDNYSFHNGSGRLIDACIELARLGYRFVRVVSQYEVRARVEADVRAEVAERMRRWPGVDDPIVVVDGGVS